MPEGVGYSGSNVVAGAGLELNYIGKHCYAYSGTLTVAGATVEALNFTTGANYLRIKLFMHYDSTNFSSGERIGYEVKLNGIQVIDAVYGDVDRPGFVPYEADMIIPPFTVVQVNLITSDASDINMSCMISGDTY